MKNYYSILEVNENCTDDDLKKAYRRLAKKFHPDINKSAKAHELFIEINEAYEVLSNTNKNNDAISSANEEQINYEAFIVEIREAARKKAHMRYEKFRKEHEAFQKSGWNDFQLLFKYIARVLAPVLGFGLIGLPIVICFNVGSIQPFFYMFLSWLIGGFILFDAFQKRKNYFKLGSFFYSFAKIHQYFSEKNNFVNQSCFYAAPLKANSHPYVITFLKIIDIKFRKGGPSLQQAGYNRDSIDIKIPRCYKAFVLHTFTTIIKIISILTALIFIHFESFLWRLIVGSCIGFLLSIILLTITNIRSKNGYLFSYGMIIKIIIWIIAISLNSKFSIKPINISTSSYIQVIVSLMFIADSFLEQLLKIPRVHLFKPIFGYYKNLHVYFNQNQILYLEIPIWTTIYPYIRWIF